jgi:CheY-like chemotaxis protein
VTISVLIVDDEPDVMTLFRRKFRRELRNGSYTFSFAESGEAALELLNKDVKPELVLILSDINMPGMSGIELLGRTKEMRPDLPVTMITAYGDEERRKAAFALGAADFVAKPCQRRSKIGPNGGVGLVHLA